MDTPMAANCIAAAGSTAYVGLSSGGLILVQFPDPVFADGFEGGDLSEWSSSVP